MYVNHDNFTKTLACTNSVKMSCRDASIREINPRVLY